MSTSGPNIQLELRLAEMARMNEEIRRRHLEVEADKRRAQRDGLMVSRDQSITMATVMPTDFDTSREDGFKDGLDSRPLPADPYGKDRVPREKRGKPQDKINTKNNKKRQQTIDEARQRGMNDQDYWRQEQARADAARIKRAQGRDGTWRREWDREKHHTDERSDNMGGYRNKREKQFSQSNSRNKEGMRDGKNRFGQSGPPGRGQNQRNNRNKGGYGERTRRQSNEHDYPRREYNDNRVQQTRSQQQQQPGQGGGRYSDRKKKQFERRQNRPQNHEPLSPAGDASSLLSPPRDVEGENDSDNSELKEYSSDEGRIRRRGVASDEEENKEDEDNDIELPPSIESQSSEAEDDIAKSLASAMAQQTLDSQEQIQVDEQPEQAVDLPRQATPPPPPKTPTPPPPEPATPKEETADNEAPVVNDEKQEKENEEANED